MVDPEQTQFRTIVEGLVWNHHNQLLFCKMHPDCGVFPGQWGFPGDGIEPGERMDQALRRELREKLGIEIEDIRPAFFKDGLYHKSFADGSKRPIYMIFLMFHCTLVSHTIYLNDEFTEYRWLSEDQMESSTKKPSIHWRDWDPGKLLGSKTEEVSNAPNFSHHQRTR